MTDSGLNPPRDPEQFMGWAVDEIAILNRRLSQSGTARISGARALSAGIHGSHANPQHRYSDGITFVGGIEGTAEANAEGYSPVVVDVIDHARGVEQRLVVGLAPTDDHSPATIMKMDGQPWAAIAWVPHQVVRRVYLTWIWQDAFGIWSVGNISEVPAPRPPDIDGTATYAQAIACNPGTAVADGFAVWNLWTRVGWWWMSSRVRVSPGQIREEGVVDVEVPFVPTITFRPEGGSGGGTDQGYVSVYQRTDGMVDFIAFGHPTNASDRNVYYTEYDPISGDVDGGRANIYTGEGLPIRRNMMEIAYQRPEYRNVRTLGVGGLSKQQLLVAQWTTSGGTTAADDPNTRYLLYTRNPAPAVVGLVVPTTGAVNSATRPEYNVSGIDLRVLLRPTTTRPSAAGDLGSKWEPTGNQRSWRAFVNTTGTVGFTVSPDGAASVTATSTEALPETGVRGVRVTYDASGLARFYYSLDGKTWIQLGADVTIAATALRASTTSLKLGRIAGGTGTTLAGTYQRWTLRNGEGGAVAADIDFERGWANGDPAGTTRADYMGFNWSLQAGTSIIARTWSQTADLGPSGMPVGYNPDIQYIADAVLVPHRDDTALVGRRLPGGLGTMNLVLAHDNGTYSETRLAEALGMSLFRGRAAFGEGGPLHGSASLLKQYGPTYETYASRPILMWRLGPTVPYPVLAVDEALVA